MPTWSGWAQQFLRAAHYSASSSNVRFLHEWAQHAQTNCNRNPIDLAIRSPGAGDCAALPGIFPKAQHYPDHATAATAFDTEVHMSFATAIDSALTSGNPYTYGGADGVVSALGSWGSAKFASVYYTETVAKQGGSGSSSGGIAPRTHHAWTDLQRSVNRRLPAALRQAEAANRATLRALSRAHKVHH